MGSKLMRSLLSRLYSGYSGFLPSFSNFKYDLVASDLIFMGVFKCDTIICLLLDFPCEFSSETLMLFIERLLWSQV